MSDCLHCLKFFDCDMRSYTKEGCIHYKEAKKDEIWSMAKGRKTSAGDPADSAEQYVRGK